MSQTNVWIMAETLEDAGAPDGALVGEDVELISRSANPSTIVSTILDCLQDLTNMSDRASSSGSSSKRPRGRRAAPKVPCDECIVRASEKKDGSSGGIELCEKCISSLKRPRRKQQEQANVRKVRRQSNAIIDTALGVRTDPIDMPWSDDRHEQHALQFFVQHSAPQLAGYFDSPFWQRMVLQAGRHEPAVRHAIAAIGALHEKLLTGSINPQQTSDRHAISALEYCNKSIKLLVNPDRGSKPNLRLLLTSAVLFCCFEALQGHCEQAIIHATQGYSLLQQYAMDPENNRWDIGSFAVELDQLTVLMRNLQRMSKGLMGKDYNMIPDPEAINAKRPTSFNSMQEARSGLELVLNQLTAFFLDMELDDNFYDLAVANAEKHLLFGPWLAAWEKAFSEYLAREHDKLSPADRKAAMILKAHETVAEILSDVDLSLGELGWDAFTNKFAAIVNLAEAVLEDSKQADKSVIEARWKTNGALRVLRVLSNGIEYSKQLLTRLLLTIGVFISAPSATLSFSLGIVDPLYEVCARCRDPSLRRRALELLARHPRQECVWSSWSAWKVGKFLMRMEEEGLEAQPKTSADIPSESRISEAWIDFSDKSTEDSGKGRVAYKKAIPRASARYALNPGLFEDWQTHDPGFSGPSGQRSTRSSSSTSGIDPSMSPGNMVTAAGAGPSRMSYQAPSDVVRRDSDDPLIRETPPQD
ncbi:uncharacterized protein LTR77_000064 [Saxophila tyrrhenica]|uniref:Uncharacterized protein n=1 Tax=Saxophila tyrrhenica TaxID=1690608 RepID=A0AAV9PRD5_9PEZI|nr:hypothetical protein LTR77_000064 [Saxophila tyrrhenica]